MRHLLTTFVSKPAASLLPFRDSMSRWTGYSAFQLRCQGQQWTILADEKDARPFLIDDACDPKLPDWLFTARWGDWGYSTWCNDIGTALKEAGNPKSRGWKRINGMDYNQLSEAWWIVFELTLNAEQVCDLMNRFKITCNIERKGVPSWRISEDIFIRVVLFPQSCICPPSENHQTQIPHPHLSPGRFLVCALPHSDREDQVGLWPRGCKPSAKVSTSFDIL